MNYKKKFTITLISLILPIVIVTIGMVIVDPYFHFHKPIKGIPYTIEDDTYINSGVLKNFDYDSVIVGSSLASLMETSIPDNRLGTNTVLVTLRGASTKNGAFLMEYALKHNRNIKNIYYSLDYHAITGNKDELSRDLPDYIYDSNPLNDTQYFLNKDVWIDGVYKVFDRNRDIPLRTTFDEAYGFDEYVQFSRKQVISQLAETYFDNCINLELQEYSSKAECIEALSKIAPEDNVVGNITCNIEPLLENNPNVQFYFYMAPMPIVRWYSTVVDDEDEQDNSELYQVCANINYVFSELIKYDNCHLSFFYNDDVTEDLYRYCDLIHWDRKVGRYIMNSMIDGDKEVSEDNKDQILFDFYKKVSEYDYNNFNFYKYPFQNTTDFDEYLTAVDNEYYEKIVLINGDVSEDYKKTLIEKGLVSDKCITGNYYYSIFDGKEIVVEKSYDEPFEDFFSYEDHNIHIITKGYSKEASISIDDGEYCPEEEVIDLVVVDTNNDMVVDSVGLNLETGEWEQY